MKNPLKACTCSQCKARKRDMNTNFKKKIRKLLNKKLRKMDFENPKYINYYYAQKKYRRIV